MEMILDRALYKEIKGMNKERLNDFIQGIYKKGKDDAEAGTINVDYNLLRADLGKIKGIGENRLNKIMTVISKHLDGNVSEKTE